MCSPAHCSTCGKVTWSGCGQHVAQVKARVPADQWCSGHSGGEQQSTSAGSFSRLFGRR